MAKKLTSREQDYSQWYNEIVQHADLAEKSGVRGCMVIKPYGFAIWEKMQTELDRMFKSNEAGKSEMNLKKAINIYYKFKLSKNHKMKENSKINDHYLLKIGFCIPQLDRIFRFIIDYDLLYLNPNFNHN